MVRRKDLRNAGYWWVLGPQLKWAVKTLADRLFFTHFGYLLPRCTIF